MTSAVPEPGAKGSTTAIECRKILPSPLREQPILKLSEFHGHGALRIVVSHRINLVLKG
jgi:hypothetical protein